LAYTESKTAKESANASRAMSEEAQRKRKERELRKQAETARKTAAGEDVNNPAALLASAFTEPQKDSTSRITDSKMGTSLPEGFNTSSIPYTIVIPASSSSLEWYDSSVRSYATIEAAREAGVWDYPSDLTERARCGVFKDLWKQGFFMGGGIKFGGEYLVYPGIILLYYFILVCFTVPFFLLP
jgi:tRNA-splicing endonuclease subunit Sen34